MGVTIKVKVNASGSGPKFDEAIEFLKNHTAYVGITKETAKRRQGKITNAQLMYIHSHGSPLHRIPPRPTIEPAIELHKDRIAELLGKVIAPAMDGDTSGAIASLKKAGRYATGQARDYFTSGNLAPNAPITINGGWMRNRKSGKVFKVKGKNSNGPLIDTGQLRQAITYVVRDKEGNDL